MNTTILALTLALLPVVQEDETEEEPGPLAAAVSGLKLRSIGPALMCGRISDLVVHPENPAVRYASAASGGVWKTTDAGTTWEPIFDGEGSYSIGCLALDPSNPHVIWVGTGENNSQRSVSWGDGVYRSRDGGASWENLGLAESEHIGRIVIDPRDSNRVFVAAQGPLWRAGGDRGLYRTTDGGANWTAVLAVDEHFNEHTGVNEVYCDPRDPDVLYASSWQRRRRQWTLLNGGPDSGIWKSTDGGDSWRELTSGLPSVDKGKIGLAVSPADPDVVYAIVEAARDEGGVFRSTDRGETWSKQSSYMTSSPQYYNELVADPTEPDRLYALDTWLQVSTDGGATFSSVPGTNRHVDDHVLWIEPANPLHMIVGCDGGIYETWNRGEAWAFGANLPITQFYRVAIDSAEPFYNVYGGTQDNNTLGGPVRTTDRMGIGNEHWVVTVGGDGFEPAIDPTDPNIVYSQWQYGNLVRHDRQSGENTDIKPREGVDDPPLRWNWDAPLLISPHSHTRLYFAGNVLFRSEDRGDSWRAVSGELSRGLDRNEFEIMGTVQSLDAVARNHATSFYGTAIALDESPRVEDLLYVGTDDGLVHVSTNGGETWETHGEFPGVPERTYVSALVASRHVDDRVYALFDAHKAGDFAPYLLVSENRGATWTSAAGDLEAPQVCWSLVEDTDDPDLLFLGTEYGLFVTLDRGGSWMQMKGGLPTIAVKDVEVQRREDDLVLATFGRSFYVLDDYSALRAMSDEVLAREGALFPTRRALRYQPRTRLGGERGRGSQGAGFFTAANPPFGAVFTYHLAEQLQTRREARWEREEELTEAGEPIPQPTWDEVRAEDDEEDPAVVLIVRDADGAVVRRVPGSREKGLHRTAWDLREPASTPVRLGGGGDRPPWMPPPAGPLVLGGTYSVTLAKVAGGVETALDGPVEFEVVPLELATLPAADAAAALAFEEKLARLQRAVRGAIGVRREAADRAAHLAAALDLTPAADPGLRARIEALEASLQTLRRRFEGDDSLSSRDEPSPTAIRSRVEQVVRDQLSSSSAPTATQEEAYRDAGRAFALALSELRAIWERGLPALEAELEAAGAPATPGRLPTWTME